MQHVTGKKRCPMMIYLVPTRFHDWTKQMMYDPVRERCMPVPVPSLDALKESIVE